MSEAEPTLIFSRDENNIVSAEDRFFFDLSTMHGASRIDNKVTLYLYACSMSIPFNKERDAIDAFEWFKSEKCEYLRKLAINKSDEIKRSSYSLSLIQEQVNLMKDNN